MHIWSKLVREECWVWNSLCISNSALDFELGLLLPVMSLKLTWHSPKFQTQSLVIKFESRDTLKWVPNTLIQFEMPCTHNFWSFLKLFMTFPYNKWSMRVCHMLGYWWYYINSLNSRTSKIFSRVWHFCGEEDKNFGLFFFSFLLNIYIYIFWFKLWIFTLLWIENVTSLPWEAKKPTWGLKHENLRARNS